jgi:cell division protein FtsB
MSKEIRIRKEIGSGRSGNSEVVTFLNSLPMKLVLLGISIFILYSVYNSVKITVQKVDIHSQAQREVAELRLQNLYLSLSMKEMSTDRYLEKEARDRLNFGANEEIVFVIPENALEGVADEVARITGEVDPSPLSGEFTLSKWIEFIERGI